MQGAVKEKTERENRKVPEESEENIVYYLRKVSRNKSKTFSYISEGYTGEKRCHRLTFYWFLRQPQKALILVFRAPGSVLSYILKNMIQFFLNKQIEPNDRIFSCETEMFHSVGLRTRARHMRLNERRNILDSSS